MAETLERYWLRFLVPPPGEPSWGLALDDRIVRWLTDGVGVTGYDLQDCLRLVQEQLLQGHPLPPVGEAVRDIDVGGLPDWIHDHRLIGVTVWRGIWTPPYNRDGPVED